MNIGILGTADIAFRRFLPALRQCDQAHYVGVASRTPEKAQKFQQQFGGRIYDTYDALLADPTIDAVYVPLPPALHYEWGKKVLLAGKHLFMEKPFTVSVAQTQALLELAAQKGLAVHENYMFLYHRQLPWIEQKLQSGAIGELRQIRMSFGFPFRGMQDFRYSKELGGGALLDCGGYPVALALRLMGPETIITTCALHEKYGVDLFGSATLQNKSGLTAQISFGMDNSYRCELEVWGSTGCLMTNRIFTAPPDFTPVVKIVRQYGNEVIQLPADHAFLNSIYAFLEKVQMGTVAEERILLQSKKIEMIQKEGFIV